MRRFINFFSFLVIVGFISFNFLFAGNIIGSNDFSINSFIKAYADGEAGDGVKNVIYAECECDNGKKGHTLDCEDVESTGEECTSDPLTKCYKVKITLIPLSANAVVCD